MAWLSSTLTLVAALCVLGPAQAQSPQRITARAFPRTAARVPYFETRINAADPEARWDVLQHAVFRYWVQDIELERLLRWLARNDPDATLRMRAIHQLQGLWVKLHPEDLPRSWGTFDRTDSEQLALLVGLVGKGGAGAGRAALTLALVQHRAAADALRGLTRDPNVFARYAAARALTEIGEVDAGRTVLERIVATQLALLARKPKATNAEIYALYAARTIVAIGGADRRKGLALMADVIEAVERAGGPPHTIYRMLPSGLAGRHLPTAAAFRAWLADDPGARQADPPPPATLSVGEDRAFQALCKAIAAGLREGSVEDLHLLCVPRNALTTVVTPAVLQKAPKLAALIAVGNAKRITALRTRFTQLTRYTFVRGAPGYRLVRSSFYRAPAAVLKNSYLELTDAHRIVIRIKLEEVVFVGDRCYLVKLD